MGLVDVRDVAEAHIKAIQIEEAKNQRFLLNGEDMWQREYAAALAEEFNPKGFCVTTKEAAEGDNVENICSHTRAAQVLGIQFKSIK